MKTAKKQLDIVLPEIQELALLGTLKPPKRKWRVRLRAALVTAGWLLRAPALERTVAPGQPALPEHEWRLRKPQRWNG